MTQPTLLITGGDSYLGSRLAQKILRNTDMDLLAWVRAKDDAAFSQKKAAMAQTYAGYEDRVTYAWGDLTAEQPFQQVDPKRITHLMHPAAVTRFNVEEETARRINLEGTEKLLRFSESCPHLEKLGFVSTVYVSGLRDGRVEEVPLDDSAGFANFYEWSKWAAEQTLLQEFSHLPWQIYRVATVIADDMSGRVTQYNAVHNTLKLFYYGLLSLLPGTPETPVYLVTGEFVTESLFHLVQQAPLQQIYHICHRQAESPSLEALLDQTFQIFEASEDFRARRILRPLFCDAESFELMVSSVSSFGSGIVNQALTSVSPFAKQLFITKDLQNARTCQYLPHYQAPDPIALIRQTVQTLVETRWGREDLRGR